MSFMMMPWAGHICISEGTLNTGREESEKEEKKDKSVDGFWVCNKPQLQSTPSYKHIPFFIPQLQDNAEKSKFAIRKS